MTTLIAALEIEEKVADGRFDTEIASTAASKALPGGTSLIQKHRNQAGLHVATTHQLRDASGNSTSHHHGKDLLIAHVLLVQDRDA